MVDRPAVRLPQKALKISKFVDTGLDNSDVEQERVVKKPQKAPKSPEFADTDSSIKDDQGPTVKWPQKASKILGLIDTGPDDEDPQETSPGPAHKEPTKPAKRLPCC